MKNESKMYDLQEDMGPKQVCEDSKVRVYLSLVRSEEERELRAREVRRRNHKKCIIRQMITAAVEIFKIGLAVGVAVLLYHFLAAWMLIQRGYPAVGSELIFAALVGGGVYYLLDKVSEGVWYEK